MRYKVKVRDIQPEIYSGENNLPRKCFLGISLSNPFFQGKHLPKVLKWIDNNFDECNIIIADHLHRFNEYIFNNKTDEDASKECVEMGKQIHENLKELIKQIQGTKFKIYHWLDYFKTQEFKEHLEKIILYFKSNPDFKNSVVNSSNQFIDKQLKRGYRIHVTREEAIKKSSEYILEEMAVFDILIQKDYLVQVYPGSQLNVLKEIANNKFPDFNTNLKNGIYIDLSIKKQK